VNRRHKLPTYLLPRSPHGAPKTQNPLKFAGVPQTANHFQPLVGQSSPYCEDMWRRYCCFTSLFSDCWYMSSLQKCSPTKLCENVQMANFCILYFQQAACSTFHTYILNSHKGHIVCGSIVDIKSATDENRREKKWRKKKTENTAAKYKGLRPVLLGGHK